MIARAEPRLDVARHGFGAAALVERVLDQAGIRLNGPAPWDLQVHDDRFYRRALVDGTLGIGESYMDGWWDCERLDELVARVLRAEALREIPVYFKGKAALAWLQARLFDLQTVPFARRSIAFHYDIGNDFFERMLGRSMAYSCAYWPEARDLNEAQDAKHELVCRKLDLRPRDRVLDIGCGWGAFASYAARHYGCRVVGITISAAQAESARQRCRRLPVEIYLLDYRAPELDEFGPFDKVASIGMFEHVGARNYRAFMQLVDGLLSPNGLFLLHTIGSLRSAASDPWLRKYIFPGGTLPSAADVVRAADGLFVMEDWHNFRFDYDRTLMAWHENYAAMVAEKPDRFDPTFVRMWRFYLLACAGAFRAGNHNQLWQILFSKRGAAVTRQR